MTHTQTARTLAAASLAAGLLALGQAGYAGTPYTATVFAQGAAVSGTKPDSITVGGGHVFVEYGNGADSSKPIGTSGASTIAEYDLSGNVIDTFSVPGLADGVRYDPYTNQLWVLQNNDGNSALTTIDPVTDAKTHYTYAATSPTRGYDDVVFKNSQAYLSYTNPVNPTDTILYGASLGAGTISLTSILAYNATGTNTATGQTNQPIIANDPDSLGLTPSGDILLTSGDDGSLTTVHNPGAGQTVSFVSLTDGGNSVSGLDDTIFAGNGPQQLLVADTADNTVYALHGPFQAGQAYASIGSTHSVDSVDLTTGQISSITDGLLPVTASPHGLAFLPAAVPEASTTVSFGLLLALGLGSLVVSSKRKRAASVV